MKEVKFNNAIRTIYTLIQFYFTPNNRPWKHKYKRTHADYLCPERADHIIRHCFLKCKTEEELQPIRDWLANRGLDAVAFEELRQRLGQMN